MSDEREERLKNKLPANRHFDCISKCQERIWGCEEKCERLPASPQGAPDANCITRPDGECIGGIMAGKEPCMHDVQGAQEVAHTDHPLRVFDRTCPGCLAEQRSMVNLGLQMKAGAQEGGSESIRQSVKKMNEQVAQDAKMFEDAHSAPPSAPASAAPEQRSAMPEEPPLIRALRHAHPRNRYGPLSQYDANEILQHIDALRAHASTLAAENAELKSSLSLEVLEHNQACSDRRTLAEQVEGLKRIIRLKDAAAPPISRDEKILAMEAAIKQHFDRAEQAEQRARRMEKDVERLDYLQSLTKGYGKGWILRDSTSGRGMRLHETSLDGAKPTVREAIDAALVAAKEQK